MQTPEIPRIFKVCLGNIAGKWQAVSFDCECPKQQRHPKFCEDVNDIFSMLLITEGWV